MQYMTERPNRGNGGLLDVPRSVEDMFERIWGVTPRRVDAWRPSVDVVETPQAYLVRLELPGLDPNDVDVTLTGDRLTIRGEKKLEEKGENQTWLLSERMTGAFERTFTFPAPVSAKDIQAEAHNGVLTIKVVKSKEAQPHKVSVRAV